MIRLIMSLSLIAWASAGYSIRPAYTSELCIVANAQTACSAIRPEHRIAYNGGSDWKLVRAKADPNGETYVSIMKTADMLRSDLEFAGLMIRCAPRGKMDILVVLISPLPPKSKPQVKITAGPLIKTYEGSITAAGAAVVLPDEAGGLAGGPWQRVSELAVTVETSGVEIKGALSLDGLGAAYSNLLRNCP